MISLNKEIISCKKCKRLVEFREKIAREKRKQYLNEEYWGKPITGFGEKSAKVIIVGLAPAAHGGNRTGRVFTGDKSAAFLYKCLNKVGISNLNDSIKIDDGLRLKKTYITTALKCERKLADFRYVFREREMQFNSRVSICISFLEVLLVFFVPQFLLASVYYKHTKEMFWLNGVITVCKSCN